MSARVSQFRVVPGGAPTLQRGDHAEVADALANSLHGDGYERLVFAEGALYGVRAPHYVWEQIAPERVTTLVHGYAGTPVVGGVKPHPLHVTDGLARGARRFLYDLHAQPQFFAAAPPGIAFGDGFAVVTSAGVDLRPHSPEHRARFAYPFAFGDVQRSPTLFLRFLEDVFVSDSDKTQKVDSIQEHLGACITGIATTYERAVLLKGPGDSGKSRLARFFVAAMPPGTVSGLPPSLMHDQYALPKLVAARLNVVPDIGREKITGAVKAIVSGEARTVRSPGERAFDLHPQAGHIFGVNPPMPEIEDTSSGFEGRWIVISFHRVFSGDPARDPDIAETIIAKELAQIVRWGLDGAVRLIRQRGHTLPPSHYLALDAWMRRADPVRRFVEHALDLGAGWTRASDLHGALVVWLAGFGETCPVTSTALGLRLDGMQVASARRKDGVHYHARVRP